MTTAGRVPHANRGSTRRPTPRAERPRRKRRAAPPRPNKLGVKAKIWLTLGPHTLFGTGKADLLEAVDRLGSLRSAARSMDMSYRYAWGLLRELDEAAGFAFLEHSGDGERSRLRLTPEGRRFTDAYRRFRDSLESQIRARFEHVFER